MTLRSALDRTLRLMRDEFSARVDDASLLGALTGTRVALIADDANISSCSAQTAFVTAAMLMARSGHQVYLLAPDLPLAGPQPPLPPGRMIEGLLHAGRSMLPDIGFRVGSGGNEYDLVIALGDSPIQVPARRGIRLNADPWAGHIKRADDRSPWSAPWWPLGSMSAATLAATEAFKAAMWKLDTIEPFHPNLRSMLAEVKETSFALAPADTPYCSELGSFDCISGGAITNAVLYILARVPGVSGRPRVIDSQFPDLSNLNRYMLLLRSTFELAKVHDLANVCGSTLPISPVVARYTPELHREIEPLANAVLIGVDDIPSRWAVQRANPAWLGIGATTHWAAMASFHETNTACAECLHPRYTPSDAAIPTAAFVSFWAGLLTASYFLRHRACVCFSPDEQHVYLTALRPENPHRSDVPKLTDCPTCAMLRSRHVRGDAA